jgi:ribosome-binding protein aMBF1 (putative translation factor)
MGEPTQQPRCEICGRHLLPGERLLRYASRDGAETTVCELCKTRAEAAGWLPEREAIALRERGETAQRRRPRGQLLGGILARAGNGRTRREDAESEEERMGRRERRTARGRLQRRRAARDPELEGEAPEGEGEAEGEPEPARPAPKPRPPHGRAPGTTLDEAIAAFNASENRRIVAGLTRSLGAAQASGLAVRTAAGVPGARLTVAWELAWYQWEVGPGKRAPEIRQSAKGETIDQLRAADRTWNLQIGEDGSLAPKQARPPVEQDEAAEDAQE